MNKPTTEDTLNEVVTLLSDLNAALEFPGYVAFAGPFTGSSWAFGTANATWGGDLSLEDGSHVLSVSSEINADSTDAHGIAWWIRLSATRGYSA